VIVRRHRSATMHPERGCWVRLRPLRHAGRGRLERGAPFLNGGRVRRSVVVTTALGLCAALLAGCSSARNALGTINSPCYVALPAAEAAVHGRGHLAGVRLVRVSALPTFGLLHRAATRPKARARRVCLVAFNGRFSATGVQRPMGRLRGTVAVVVLRYPDNRVLATVILRRPEIHFGHPHLLSLAARSGPA